MAIYFVTEKWLKENTPIAKNVDVKDITVWLQVNSENWVMKIIGTYFFKDLLIKYNNKTLSSDEAALVEIMKPAIAWRAASDAVFGLSYQLKPKGLQQQNGDYSTESELNEVQFAMQHYADKAGIYEARIYEFLADKENIINLPSYTDMKNRDALARKCGGNGNNYNKSVFIF